ncbi:HAD-IC family P-type ATPase [Cellulomonas sp. APG4]|nr:HAD-IC family P-type ATPase [Cellulomonas sp. APG4]
MEQVQGEVPWARTPDEVLGRLDSHERGLSGAGAGSRLEAHGPNRVPGRPPTPWWRRLLAQVQDVLVYVLLASAALKALLGEWVDVWVIAAVTVINVAVGLVQEGRAQRALDAISAMVPTRAHVRRDGTWAEVDADSLVPGDVVRVRSGDRVPADVRLLHSANLQADESALTGESVATSKSVAAVDARAALGDRTCMLYSGTLVTAGTGVGVVTATGTTTEIGRIEEMVAQADVLTTPLARALNRFGTQLAVGILVLAVVMVAVGALVHGWALGTLVSAAIGFAVAAVPEGLPALVTITLALGVQQMARRRAIMRRLPAVETLGSVTTICSDKTGTLTRNEMTAQLVRTAAAELHVTGGGYALEGEVRADDGVAVRVADRGDLDLLARVMALCNDAHVTRADDGTWHLAGSPTEGAVRVLAAKAGFDGEGWSRRAVLPFESDTKYMGVVVEGPDGGSELLVKGAPDRVLALCTRQVGADGDPQPLDADLWRAQIDAIGTRGLRVLAAARASGRTHGSDDDALRPEHLVDLDLVGLVGIADPPRPEAVAAVAECRAAGIDVTMVTGDHAGTARAIGRELGIVTDATVVLTGAELDDMDDDALRAVVRDARVFARTSPTHKVRIVRALQHHGHVVAMTGDGVNDAPALSQADVGVAMGVKGTAATKEAADVVLADDNFATIEHAVEEGRRIFDNIRKSVLFLLPANGAQSLVILVAVLAGFTLPLAPAQVLWINMAVGITLSLALANEPAEPGLMRRPPRDTDEPLLTRAMLRHIVAASVIIGAAAIGLFVWQTEQGVPLAEARTATVTALAVTQMAYLFSSRFPDRSSLTPAVLRGNRSVWWSCLALLVLQLAFVYLPFLQGVFGSVPLGLEQWGAVLVLSTVVLLLVEAAGAALRAHERRGARRPQP